MFIDKQGRTAYRGSGLRRPVRIESPSFVQTQDGTFYPSLPLLFTDYAISSVTARGRILAAVEKASSVLWKLSVTGVYKVTMIFSEKYSER